MANVVTKNLPNTITSLNLFSGCLAVSFGFQGDLRLAFIFILCSAVLDFFDGFAARLFHAYSVIGKELDSLADVISFGLAPGVILFSLFKEVAYPECMFNYAFLFPYLGFVIAIFSALRLAKFNVDENQTTSFIGLPTPANAIFIAGLANGGFAFWACPTWGLPLLILLVILSSFLLVCNISMFSLKMKSFSFYENRLPFIFLIISLALIVLFESLGFALSIVLYILFSIINNIVKK